MNGRFCAARFSSRESAILKSVVASTSRSDYNGKKVIYSAKLLRIILTSRQQNA